jgi:hypothetical protein
VALTKFRECLAVFAPKPVEQLATAGICKGFEHFVFIGNHRGNNMQPFSCMSSIICGFFLNPHFSPESVITLSDADCRNQ